MTIGKDVRHRAARGVLPFGNVGLDDGRTLILDQKDTLRMQEMRRGAGMTGETRVWRTLERRELLVIGSIDYTPRWGGLLHISFSYPHRLPDWNEVKAIKRAFFGDDLGASMHLPRPEYYINLHPNTFHLWEDPEEWDLQ